MSAHSSTDMKHCSTATYIFRKQHVYLQYLTSVCITVLWLHLKQLHPSKLSLADSLMITSWATYWMTLKLVLKGIRVFDNKSKGCCVGMQWVFNISGGSYPCPSDPISSSSFLKNQIDHTNSVCCNNYRPLICTSYYIHFENIMHDWSNLIC